MTYAHRARPHAPPIISAIERLAAAETNVTQLEGSDYGVTEATAHLHQEITANKTRLNASPHPELQTYESALRTYHGHGSYLLGGMLLTMTAAGILSIIGEEQE